MKKIEMSLEEWLSELGLDRYLAAFTENDIDLNVIDELGDDDLKEIGMSLGHRRRLLKAIRKQGESDDSGSNGGDYPSRRLVKSSAIYSAEKRFMTLMFCDLADSTRLASELDIEENHEVNRAYQEACTEVVSRFGGYVAKYMGDGVLAYFGFPSAREDDAERSVKAGLEIVKAIDGLNTQIELPSGMRLAGRIGIATGSVVVEPIGQGHAFENAVVGEAPNLAARLEQYAAAGTVMIGPDTHQLVKHSFDLEDRGEKPIKGYQKPLRVWQVVRSRTVEEKYDASLGNHLTRLIGRDEELALLISRWQRSIQGNGQVVLLSGDAGVGKSRMIEELLSSIEEPHQCIRFFCEENLEQSPLFPVINNLLKQAGVSSLRRSEEKREKLTALLKNEYQWQPDLINTLLSLAVPDVAEETEGGVESRSHALKILQEKLASTIIMRSQQQPVLVVIEDAHWIDASSQSLMDLLARMVQTQRVMLVVSYRVENPVQYASSNVTSLSLASLTREHSNTLIREIARNSDLPEEIVTQISMKSDGVPLFIEEISKTLSEDAISDGSEVMKGPQHVPDTLQASLISRLDQLGEARVLAQCGAVIGNTFELDIASHIANLTNEILDSALDSLVKNRVAVSNSEGMGQTLRFRHALVRDAAYESLLRKHRTQLHIKVAEYLESTYREDQGAICQIIAHHFAAAGLYGKAFFSWLTAGDSALKAGATDESAELLNKAQGVLSRLDPGEVDTMHLYQFYMCHGKALNASVGAISETARAAFQSAADIAAAASEIELQVDALDYLFGITFNAGNIRQSIDYANQMLKIGGTTGSKIAIVSGHQGLGMAYCTLGEFAEAESHLHSALNYKDDNIEGINCFPSMTLDYLSYVKCIVGDPETAKELCDKAIDSATSESPYATAVALNNTCFTEMMLGDHHRVKELSERAIEIAEQNGQFIFLKRARLFNSLSRGWLEKSPEHLGAVAAMIDEWKRSNEVFDLTYLIGMTAELQIQLGQIKAALELIEHALSISESTEENFYRAELIRLKAVALMSKSDSGQTDSDFAESPMKLLDQATVLSQSQNALGWRRRVEETSAGWKSQSNSNV